MSTSTPSNGRSPMLAIILVLLAVLFLGGAIFYATQQTSFLAGAYGIHYKHAILSAVLCVVALVAANFVRPRTLS